MSFRGLLRPGQGFKLFRVLRRASDKTPTGRPYTGALAPIGELNGIITEASPEEIEQFKQKGHPITHTIVQRGTTARASANDVLELLPSQCDRADGHRRFLVKVEPKDPGELGHFLIYRVEERTDLE